MSEKREGGRPRQRTPEEAARLVAEYDAGEWTKREFCRKHGLAESTLDAYRSGRRLALAVKRKTAQWVAVEAPGGAPAAEGGTLTVVLAKGRRIEVGRGFDAAALQELLRVLERA